MHLYNSWLPPPLLAQIALETDAFALAVQRLQQTWQPQDPASASATTKWISVVNNFLKARSELAISDVELFVKVVLDLIINSQDNAHVQARWGSVLNRFLKKYGKKLTLSIHWKPFYELLMRTHFKRRQSFQGLALKQVQVGSLISLVRHCRCFFPKGSAAEIWSEFRPLLGDLSHNSSLEAAGFVSLFLPTNSRENFEFFTSEWLEDCLQLWAGVSNCHFWDVQWASLIGRCLKHHVLMPSLNLEPFLPALFSHYLRSFEVPVGKASASYPFQREVPSEVMLAFSSGWSLSFAKDVAKAIVFLLKPRSSAQQHFEMMINLLEQYYHPSNGGPWTSSLEQFLRYLVLFFLKRVAQEQRQREKGDDLAPHGHFLEATERRTFVKAVMQLVDRGQYSKNSMLAGTAAITLAGLSFIEPLSVLPLTISRFYIALDTITATHQLEAAVTTVALSARSLLLASSKGAVADLEVESKELVTDTPNNEEYLTSCRDLLVSALSNTLLGLDANDPPKTLATLQLFCSIFSSLSKLGNEDDEATFVLPIDWSQWLDDFLTRLFVLLVHLEPSGQSVEDGVNNGSNLSSKTFLLQGGSFYDSLLQLLFGRLTRPLFQQALKKVAKFVHSNVLPGAVAEIGLLCSAVVYTSPEEGMVQIIGPMINTVFSSLQEAPHHGFNESGSSLTLPDLKLTLSPALETKVVYQLNVLSVGLTYGGSSVLQYKDLLKKTLEAAFDAPSSKVNEAGGHVLNSVLGSLILYYPLDQYTLHSNYPGLDGIEEWLSTKCDHSVGHGTGPTWHIPNVDEITFANELLELHLRGALSDLRSLCQGGQLSDSLGREKDRLRITLLRIGASLRGVWSCLPDFQDPNSKVQDESLHFGPSYLAGAAGVVVGGTHLREYAAETIHFACRYFMEKWADESILLTLLANNMDMIGNYGSIEYVEWSNGKYAWRADSRSLLEPATNFITNHHALGRQRPKWMVIEMLFLHGIWRASQSQYNIYRVEAEDLSTPQHIVLLTTDLLKLSLHNYDAVRQIAAASLKKIFKRFPSSVKTCMPVLLSSLQDPTASEHSALGACAILTSRPTLRHVTQDWNAMTSLLLAILNSAHHESVKCQSAINELFIVFSVRCGGVPLDFICKSEEDAWGNYADIIRKIQDSCASSVNIHWRYNLMAQGMLILLLVSPSIKASGFSMNTVLRTREHIAGHFLSNLKSELPPLRPLSVVALLFLLQASPHKSKQNNEDMEQSAQKQQELWSLESSLTPILREQGFGSVVLHNLSLDHHYQEGQTRTSQGGFGRSVPQRLSDIGMTTLIPSFLRDWPRTRTWDSVLKGDAFSARYAKLFKRLVQECGSVALDAFQVPLEEASSALEERGKQCAAAEVLAGFIQSDVECVLNSWEEWLRPLFRKVLLQSSIESMSEWAACVRFAVTGKGRGGRNPPLMRSLVLDCLAEPVPPSVSSSILAKRFTLIYAALVELPPSYSPSREAIFQKNLLEEVLNCMSHPAPQVRESVGNVLCVLSANLQLSSLLKQKDTSMDSEKMEMDSQNWKLSVINRVNSAVAKIQTTNGTYANGVSQSMAVSDMNHVGHDEEVQEAVKLMETVLYFMITAVKSGRSTALMDIIIELLQPVLSLQETSHKDLSTLAKSALHFLKWQPFQAVYLSKVVSSLLAAANDINWHTRIATLTFLQSFIYRHTYILSTDDLATLWIQVEKLLADSQLEVRELASSTLAGMMKGVDSELARTFREQKFKSATSLLNSGKTKNRRKIPSHVSSSAFHGIVLGLAACILSVPYDMPSWLPDTITTLARFKHEPPPVRTTVTKTVAEFRRTHADTWTIHRILFTEEQLEVLTDTSSASSYFA